MKDLRWLRASFLFSLLEIPLAISTSTTWPTTRTRKIVLYRPLQIWFKKLFSFNKNIYIDRNNVLRHSNNACVL